MCACSEGLEPMKAMCLNAVSGHYQQMVNGGCVKHEVGCAITIQPTPMRTIYLISGAKCCDHILSAGFVTDKIAVWKLVEQHMVETVVDNKFQFIVKVDIDKDIVTATEIEGGYIHTYHIQTVKRVL
jgi:hypothetical protein